MPENVRDILYLYLTKKGFGGLYNPDMECGCQNDDLMPCDDNFRDCIPGYKCKADPMSGYDFMICPTKEEL